MATKYTLCTTNIPKTRRSFYDDLPEDMTIFDEGTLYEVETLSGSLDPSEVLDYYGLSISDLDSSPSDATWFKKAHQRGRTKAKLVASDRLFAQMTSRNGQHACLAYLQRFAKNFEGNLDTNTHQNDKQYSFTVVLDE
jgi:hypothetical protein